MLLAQSVKCRGLGGSAPKGHGSTQKPDEPDFLSRGRILHFVQHDRVSHVIASRSAASRLVSERNPGYLLGATPKRSLSVSFRPGTNTDKRVCPCHPDAQCFRSEAKQSLVPRAIVARDSWPPLLARLPCLLLRLPRFFHQPLRHVLTRPGSPGLVEVLRSPRSAQPSQIAHRSGYLRYLHVDTDCEGHH